MIKIHVFTICYTDSGICVHHLSRTTSDNNQVPSRTQSEKHDGALEDPGGAMTDLKSPDMQPSKSFETRTTMTSLGDDNIIYAVMKIGADENLLDAQANVAACRQLANGQKLPILCDYRQIRKQSRDAQIFYASDEVSNTYSACAILVESPVSKMVANFFLGLRKPKTPTRLFTDEKMAVAWLHEHK